MIKYKYDVQCLIDGHDLDEDAIDAYIKSHFEGDSLIAVGDETLVKIHFHTNKLGKFWNIVRHWARFLISSLKIWIVRPVG